MKDDPQFEEALRAPPVEPAKYIYQCLCCICGAVFEGHKRDVCCPDCKAKPPEPAKCYGCIAGEPCSVHNPPPPEPFPEERHRFHDSCESADDAIKASDKELADLRAQLAAAQARITEAEGLLREAACKFCKVESCERIRGFLQKPPGGGT